MKPCPVCGETYFRQQGPNGQGEKFYEHGRPWKTFCVSRRDDSNELKRNEKRGR